MKKSCETEIEKKQCYRNRMKNGVTEIEQRRTVLMKWNKVEQCY